MSTNGLILIYTGSIIEVQRIKSEFELNGIVSITKDGFRQGIEAGFGGGIPSAIDLFVNEKDLKRAKEIIEAILE